MNTDRTTMIQTKKGSAEHNYTTQLFEMMRMHNCNQVATLLRKLPRKDMSEQCQLELDFLANFYSGKMQISRDEDGEYYIDSVCGSMQYHGFTTDNCSAYSVRIGDESSDAVAYMCWIEQRGTFTALVCCGESLAIWPNIFVRKR